MGKAEVYVRDLKGRVRFVSKELSEVYRAKGWRVLHSRPPIDIHNLNNEINSKLREESSND